MKNIHILPTDKPTWLHKSTLTGVLRKSSSCIDDMKQAQGMNIYITSNEEIKEGDYGLSKLNEVVRFGKKFKTSLYKKIILTTDVELIKDGVQSIDDEFLEWFVKNPDCEEVGVEIKTTSVQLPQQQLSENRYDLVFRWINKKVYKLIIPKQDTPEQHIELINNNIDELDEQLTKFKEKQKDSTKKMSKYEKTKKILKIELSDNEEIIQIKLKPKYHKLKNEDKSKVLERLIRWGRDELNCLYPEQD